MADDMPIPDQLPPESIRYKPFAPLKGGQVAPGGPWWHTAEFSRSAGDLARRKIVLGLTSEFALWTPNSKTSPRTALISSRDAVLAWKDMCRRVLRRALSTWSKEVRIRVLTESEYLRDPHRAVELIHSGAGVPYGPVLSVDRLFSELATVVGGVLALEDLLSQGSLQGAPGRQVERGTIYLDDPNEGPRIEFGSHIPRDEPLIVRLNPHPQTPASDALARKLVEDAFG